MKQSKGASKSHVPHMPLEKRRFPLSAQAGAKSGRDAVRAGHPVRAPHQSIRHVEKSPKNPTGT